MTEPSVAPRELAFERYIAFLLLAGVLISAAILLFGLILFLVTGKTGYHESVSVASLTGPDAAAAIPHAFGDIARGVLELRPFAVVELGVLTLIATPVVRVAASVLLFLEEGDRAFVLVTLGVLALLLSSIFLLH